MEDYNEEDEELEEGERICPMCGRKYKGLTPYCIRCSAVVLGF